MLYVAGEDTDDLMTGPSLELWPSCRLERTEIFEMKTRQKTAELLIPKLKFSKLSRKVVQRLDSNLERMMKGNIYFLPEYSIFLTGSC